MEQVEFMDKLIEGLLGQGVLGILVIGLAMYLLQKEKKHEQERKEIMNMHREERREFQQIAQKGYDSVEKNAGLIEGLSKLIESNTRK